MTPSSTLVAQQAITACRTTAEAPPARAMATWSMVSRPELEEQLEAYVQAATAGTSRCEKTRAGLRLLLDRLELAPGEDWPARWRASGADDIPRWDLLPGAGPGQRSCLQFGLRFLLAYRVVLPSYRWLLAHQLVSIVDDLRIADGPSRHDFFLTTAARNSINASVTRNAAMVLARVLLHTGKHIDELTTADLLAYRSTLRERGKPVHGLHVAHRILCEMGVIEDDPLTVGFTRRRGQQTIEQLVDGHGVENPAVRNLLIDYLRERSPALDHASTRQLALRLVKLFWRDLELHHPGIASLRLPPEVIRAWKAHVASLPDGRPRNDLATLLMTVRAFYLDLAHWAVEDPARWASWVAPCPIAASETQAAAKAKKRRQARMHDRIRQLVPLLPRVVAAAEQRLQVQAEVLHRIAHCPIGGEVDVDDRRFRRLPVTAQHVRNYGQVLRAVEIGPQGEQGKPFNCRSVEDDAFWTWAVIEVLRLTGIRIEELFELTHLSIRRYRQGDGQLVLLLQVAPSKIDQERVIPISPELSHVLARIVNRVKGENSQVPLLRRYDPHERTLSPALPYLFQRQRAGGRVAPSQPGVQGQLDRAVAVANLRDTDGQPVRFTPHDFRRIFATEAVNSGLPLHIAAKLLGHLDLNTTRSYTAVYDEEVIGHYQQHLARRRAAGPSDEYRQPTPQEWADFEQHFRKRKMALGDCYRPYGTSCPHEHACIRCPMLRMDPAQLPRLLQIERNTEERLEEARQQHFLGEVEALQLDLQHIGEKKAQVARICQQLTSRALPLVSDEPELTHSHS